MSADEAKRLYIAWLARENPRVYERVIATAQQRMREARLSGLEGWVDSLVNAAVAVGGAVMAKKQADKAAGLQKKQAQADLQFALLDVNTRRAQAGLPPVDINGNVIPAAQLPAPATLKSILPASAGASAPDYLPWVVGGGLALAGVLLVTRGR